ncbi:uncharacterized protein BX664DRAFT_379003 [Halteromyces radiatus]|uniref:uncharacterized protein n=1 Tax=Halteromyces radiatus TaxID=101107 RepID=UPI00221EFD90|nr:uncharacterized protein BX664DRAFT_379003 [Halteromyces radiatus]KAI8093892.1 hypothetical protein BX664DRAFT_379003 [Halteromyces radiatus]
MVQSVQETQDELDKALETSCMIDDTTKKTKKKKKNKKKIVQDIDDYYLKTMMPYPVTLKATKTKGRHAVASCTIDQGTTVCLEKATAFVVRSDYIDQQCHVCLDDLSTKMMCSDCKMVYYCSQTCVQSDHHHTRVCALLSQVIPIGQSTDVDPDLLRLMIYLLAKRQQNDEEEEEEEDGSTPYRCVLDLLSHKENASLAFIKVVTDAAQRLMMEDPDFFASLSVDDLVTLACRINSNAHGLGDNHARNTDVALGLFPVGALFFNHSCNPNAAFVGLEKGQLLFRTIRPVKQDEEIAVSYIDLYASRDERRQNLLATKHFWCKCKRCSSPMDTSVDRFLHGVVCTQCTEDVYVIPASTIEDISRGQTKLYTTKDDEVWPCAKCGHVATAKTVRDTISQAQDKYTNGMKCIRKERNYRRARKELEPLVNTTLEPGKLHPQDAIRFNASIPLMNCLRYENDIKRAADINKIILDFMQEQAKQHLPEYTSEVADFWQNLGELCDSLATQYRHSLPPLEKKWNKDARNAFTQATKVRSIVFGPNHPKTLLVKKFTTQSSA